MSPFNHQVFEEWKALMHREKSSIYQVNTLSCTSRPCHPALREELCDWFYRLIDHCDIERCVVSIAFSYFDRYLPHHESMTETLLQLVAMTSIYLAVKLHSTRKISVQSLARLSQGNFRVDQILKMEISIIKTLHWHLNPPTPFMYLAVASPLIQDSTEDVNESADVQNLASYLMELSVCDQYFADKKGPSVACAAIVVAMDTLHISKKRFLHYGLEHSQEVTDNCIQRLHQLYDHVVVQLDEDDTVRSRRGLSPTTTVI